MTQKSIRIGMFAGMVLAAIAVLAAAAEDKYSLKVPGGLAFSEFRGYEDWQTVAVSKTDAVINAILANTACVVGIPWGKPL